MQRRNVVALLAAVFAVSLVFAGSAFGSTARGVLGTSVDTLHVGPDVSGLRVAGVTSGASLASLPTAANAIQAPGAVLTDSGRYLVDRRLRQA